MKYFTGMGWDKSLKQCIVECYLQHLILRIFFIILIEHHEAK